MENSLAVAYRLNTHCVIQQGYLQYFPKKNENLFLLISLYAKVCGDISYLLKCQKLWKCISTMNKQNCCPPT